MSTSQIELLEQKLAAERDRLWAAIRRFSAGELERSLKGGWSAKDILAHLAFAEGVNVRFARLMLSRELPVQAEEMAREYPDYAGPFTLDSFNAYMQEKLRSQSTTGVLAALRTTRAETLAWIETLTPEQLDRGGRHAAWGDKTVRDMIRILALHDKTHTQELIKSRPA